MFLNKSENPGYSYNDGLNRVINKVYKKIIFYFKNPLVKNTRLCYDKWESGYNKYVNLSKT